MVAVVRRVLCALLALWVSAAGARALTNWRVLVMHADAVGPVLPSVTGNKGDSSVTATGTSD